MQYIVEELIDYIDKIGYNNSQKIIEQLSQSDDYNDRMAVASALCFFENNHSVKVLTRMLFDKEELVRIEAADSLSSFKSKRAYAVLLDSLTDTSPLARGYKIFALAANSTSENRDKTIVIIEEYLEKEKNTFSKINCLLALCYLGKIENTKKLCTMYSKCNYRNRCAIINGIADLKEYGISLDDKFIMSFYSKIKNDCEKSVLSAINYYCMTYFNN